MVSCYLITLLSLTLFDLVCVILVFEGCCSFFLFLFATVRINKVKVHVSMKFLNLFNVKYQIRRAGLPIYMLI